MKDSISVIMPAFNEAKNIQSAIVSVCETLGDLHVPFELIVIDDGSDDATGEIAGNRARLDKRIRVFRNIKNRGFGYSLRRGLKEATQSYVCIFPSDNEMSARSFKQMIGARTSADFVSTYNGNPGNRTMVRQVISKLFVILMNVLSGRTLRYHTGPFICKTTCIKGLPLVSDGLAVLAELRAKAFVQKDITVREIPFEFVQRKHGRSTALSRKNVTQTAKTLFNLFLFRLRATD